ncbi:toxin-antitoxin system YwqK family antitoxin [Fusobacterium nucleatum]|uniref:toxin-antitoxin system YwqK family antitoxin n=1 Tax=Fusobacterium nucleatum TaxID=851 RepID=UPI0030D07B2A
MKKVLSALLLIIAMLLSACGEVKYEYKDGVMYGDGKEATGTFEFKAGKYKVKGNFVNGLPDGTLEKYYSDGNIMVKDTYVNGENTKEEIYYKNGQLMGTFSDDEDLKFYYDDGKLIMTYNDKIGETLIYHENGNPLMTTNNKETAIYNENNEMLFKVENNKIVDIGATLKNLENGSFEFVKDNKVIAKIDANGEIINYLYSTGETMLKVNETTGVTEFFFKNGNTFMKQEGNKSIVNYKDGKTLYEIEGDVWKFYNQEGEEIISNFELITDIKKVD